MARSLLRCVSTSYAVACTFQWLWLALLFREWVRNLWQGEHPATVGDPLDKRTLRMLKLIQSCGQRAERDQQESSIAKR